MRLHPILLSACLWSLLLGNLVWPRCQAGSPSRRTAIVQAVEQAKPAVVNIHSERTARGPAVEELFATSPSQHRSNGMGTGIIMDPRGYIVTNHHVVEDVAVIRVRLSDGSTHIARVVARDRENDLALMKIDAGRSLATITIGTSSDLMLGESVIAIGNAYGYEHTVTDGIISALNRDVTLNKEISYKRLIQTNASINPGNSGGPLLNIDGELVGVNVAIRAGAQGIAFAIPVDQMVEVVTDLVASRRRTEVFHGLHCRNVVDTKRAPVRHLEVARVDGGSPATRAGFKNGDVILRVGEVPIQSSLDLELALLDIKPGEGIPVRIRRGENERVLELTLEAIPPAALSPADLAWRQLGVRLIPAGPELLGRSNPILKGGMVITEVQPGGPGAKAGMQRGDILLGLHQWETIKMDDLSYILAHSDLNSFYPLKFYLSRNGQIHQGKLQLP